MVDGARASDEGEFNLIARIFAPLATDPGGLNLRDDAAVLPVTEGHELVITCDTLVQGVHFLETDPGDSVGHKALAVNLSDLSAKGTRGYVYTLSLALPPDISTAWLENFAQGLEGVQQQTGITLIGGDTTSSPGPLTITITAIGLVWANNAVTRLGAKPGDQLYVSGTIGDAYLGLRLLREPVLAEAWGLTDGETAYLIGRYRRPELHPHIDLLVRNFAQAAIDVSDGLVGDIEKLCDVSHVGAKVDAARVPLSGAAQKVLRCEPHLLPTLITAGDDYCVVAAVSEKSARTFESEAEQAGVPFKQIGAAVEPDAGLSVRDAAGLPLTLNAKGFSHF